MSAGQYDLYVAAGPYLFSTEADAEKAFKKELERSTDAQIQYRSGHGDTVLTQMAGFHDWPEITDVT